MPDEPKHVQNRTPDVSKTNAFVHYLG